MLGSMPGVASLEAVRYYAHPRNAFWPILGELCGFDAAAPYEQRLEGLRAAGVALWDVLHSCVRAGSLDGDIEPDSVRPNDFDAFFGRHAGIEAVFCNGGAAYQLYLRRVRPELKGAGAGLPVTRLPSTSPANAGMRFAEKLAAWREALAPHLR